MSSELERTLAQLPPWFWTMVALSFGAVWGSFLNVVIYRVPRNKSLVTPPSSCPSCGARIKWYDNVPILGWLWLRGKCRSCRAAISSRYPMIELCTAMVSLALMHRFGPTGSYVYYFVFACMLIALSFIDLDTWLIPDVITYPGLIFGLLGAFLLLPGHPVADRAGAALIGGGLLLAVALGAKVILKKDGMGYGDVKLIAVIGAFSGTGSLIFVVLLSSLQGALIGAIWLRMNKDKPPPPPQEDGFVPPPGAVPFGPFLSLAAIEYTFFSDQLHALLGLVRFE
jgi:leader peptidase (prepilin peptidase)/N-methyltransferase